MRKLLFLLSLCLLLTCLVACGGDTNKPSDTTAKTESTTEAPTEGQTTATEGPTEEQTKAPETPLVGWTNRH